MHQMAQLPTYKELAKMALLIAFVSIIGMTSFPASSSARSMVSTTRIGLLDDLGERQTLARPAPTFHLPP
jgi:hypothetical protein